MVNRIEVVEHGATIVAKSCGVAYCSFGIEAYGEICHDDSYICGKISVSRRNGKTKPLFFLPSYLIYQNVFVYSQTENNKEETKTLSKEK